MNLIDQASKKTLETIETLGKARFRDLVSYVKNPSTLSSRLRFLSSQGLIMKKGREYKLSETGRTALKGMQIVDDVLIPLPQINISRIPWKLAPLVSTFGSELIKRTTEVVAILVFGSVARNEHTSASDIDFLIVVEPNADKEQIRKTTLDVTKGILSTEAYIDTFLSEVRSSPSFIIKTEVQLWSAITFLFEVVLDAIIIFDKESRAEQLLNRAKRKMKEWDVHRIETIDGWRYLELRKALEESVSW